MAMTGPSHHGTTDGVPDEDHDLRVPPTRIPERGGGSRAALVAGAAILAVIGLGVVTATRDQQPSPLPSLPRPAAIAAAGPASPTGGAPTDTAPPRATGSPLVLPTRLTAQGLTRAVTAGALDGQLVFIDGHLEAIELPCDGTPAPDHTCILTAVQGLNLRVNAGAPSLPWPGDPSRRALLVFEADADRGLTYLGSLVATPGGSEDVLALTRRLFDGELGDPPRNLFDVRGYLFPDGFQACQLTYGPDGECPPSAPFLSPDPPTSNGGLGSIRGFTVDLAPPGVDMHLRWLDEAVYVVTLPAGSPCRTGIVDGPCFPEGVRWQVVARYVPELSARAVIP